MIILLSIQGITYVKSAEILIANLAQVHQTSLLTQWRCESGEKIPRLIFAGFRIAKQPIFPRNKFGMSETSYWIGFFSRFVKFHLVQGGNRQEITCKNNVVQGGKLSLIKQSKTRLNPPEGVSCTHAQTFFSSAQQLAFRAKASCRHYRALWAHAMNTF